MGTACFLYIFRLYVARYATMAILFVIAVVMLTGCESPSPTPHGVNITLNGKPVFVHPGAKIVVRDPITGRFIAPRVIDQPQDDGRRD